MKDGLKEFIIDMLEHPVLVLAHIVKEIETWALV